MAFWRVQQIRYEKRMGIRKLSAATLVSFKQKSHGGKDVKVT